jgi:uncharacterized coiled-coil protein SlyX
LEDRNKESSISWANTDENQKLRLEVTTQEEEISRLNVLITSMRGESELCEAKIRDLSEKFVQPEKSSTNPEPTFELFESLQKKDQEISVLNE